MFGAADLLGAADVEPPTNSDRMKVRSTISLLKGAAAGPRVSASRRILWVVDAHHAARRHDEGVMVRTAVENLAYCASRSATCRTLDN